jgi:hypothetical protein
MPPTGRGEHLDDRGALAMLAHRQKNALVAPIHGADPIGLADLSKR